MKRMAAVLQANAALSENARRLKQAETGAGDLQRRVDELDRDLQTANADNRRLHDELAGLKKNNDDLQGKVDALTRENSKLSGNIEHSANVQWRNKRLAAWRSG